MRTRLVLDGKLSLFGVQIPNHWTADIQDGGSVPISVPLIHFSGNVRASALPAGIRAVLEGHVTLFGFGIPIHWTADIPNGTQVAVSIPALHYTGQATATRIPDPQPALPMGEGART